MDRFDDEIDGILDSRQGVCRPTTRRHRQLTQLVACRNRARRGRWKTGREADLIKVGVYDNLANQPEARKIDVRIFPCLSEYRAVT